MRDDHLRDKLCSFDWSPVVDLKFCLDIKRSQMSSGSAESQDSNGGGSALAKGLSAYG
jgi:hypothetical protein